ncbi:hypothetical protein A2627_04405 [Candidatus Woesebacteria bacterium RIFCSPHIGHO2_01_FULL_39_28]|uniref:MobA-like NTP transferase domain-containing protein n=1 Tax=Candidatus Woesebacteria bacterium RIFCSPHIGHO2_01_FULL_39_28 TaxID=1802496 RepID=A0A1F7YEA0_9BACT|nr:MAG: hypothetical protein A2627_04405 [Candidatus Woesebacteria bacterium RIFCSPHIGHO2_01_FULL_39_28]OGM57770.1 MAG: hypothetical protein A3A50_05665 [Candidatus Woesebacteria bacterium RIFCSPLOWO2_01_FULL_38_20]
MTLDNVLIAAGGYGTRMGIYMEKLEASSKSLIKIKGKTIIEYIIDEVYPLFNHVYISIDNNVTFEVAQNLFGLSQKISLFKNSCPGPACFPRQLLHVPFLFLYGHVPITKEYIQKIITMFTFNNSYIIVSGQKSSSDRFPISAYIDSSNRVISKVLSTNTKVLDKNEFFIEPPFVLLPHIVKNVSVANAPGKTNIKPLIMYTSCNQIKLLESELPVEINYPEELSTLEKFIENNKL